MSKFPKELEVVKLNTLKELDDIPLKEKLLAIANKYSTHKLGLANIAPPTPSDINDLRKLTEIVAILNKDTREENDEKRKAGNGEEKEITIEVL